MLNRSLILTSESSASDFPVEIPIEPPIPSCRPAFGRSKACLHDERMRSTKLFQHGIILKLKAVMSELFRLCGRNLASIISMIDRHLFPFFLHHRFRVLHPPVVKDSSVGWSNPSLRSALEILLRLLEAEPHGIATGLDLAAISNDPHGSVIEPGIRRPIVCDKMQIAEQEPFYLGITEMEAHRFLNDRQIVFVHHLVGLNIECPIASTVCQRNVGLLGINHSVLSH